MQEPRFDDRPASANTPEERLASAAWDDAHFPARTFHLSPCFARRRHLGCRGRCHRGLIAFHELLLHAHVADVRNRLWVSVEERGMVRLHRKRLNEVLDSLPEIAIGLGANPGA